MLLLRLLVWAFLVFSFDFVAFAKTVYFYLGSGISREYAEVLKREMLTEISTMGHTFKDLESAAVLYNMLVKAKNPKDSVLVVPSGLTFAIFHDLAGCENTKKVLRKFIANGAVYFGVGAGADIVSSNLYDANSKVSEERKLFFRGFDLVSADAFWPSHQSRGFAASFVPVRTAEGVDLCELWQAGSYFDNMKDVEILASFSGHDSNPFSLDTKVLKPGAAAAIKSTFGEGVVVLTQILPEFGLHTSSYPDGKPGFNQESQPLAFQEAAKLKERSDLAEIKEKSREFFQGLLRACGLIE